MKRLTFLLLIASFVSLSSGILLAANPAPANSTKEKEVPSAGLELAALTTQVTGIAISPLLGVSAVGAYQYFTAPAEKKPELPWFANPLVWSTGLLMVGACAFKDTFGAALPPGFKKPFDVLETTENKLSGLVATGAVVPVLVNAATKMMSGTHAAVDVPAAAAGGLAMLHYGAIDFSWALSLLMVPLTIAVFCIVWVVAHAINVLILLSPWGAVDTVLKTARTSVLGLVTATAYIDPVVGATLSVVIIILSYFMAGWAFRLMVFGTVFSWDFLTRRRHRYTTAGRENWVFTGREIDQAPIRSFGRLTRRDDGRLELVYKPWLLLPERKVELPAEGLAVGQGLFWPTVEFRDKEGKDRTLLTLPPRYKGHEREFADVYAIPDIRDVGLRRGWAILKELFGRGEKVAAVPAQA
ncbi:MAG: hypothetical protein PHQ04_02295 [Opitutaceae bacterium]|nr:hypothetical protein [Opitutaceae bacterium]